MSNANASSSTATAAAKLAAFTLELDGTQVPPDVHRRTREMLCDTVAVSLFGSRQRWSQLLREQALASAALGHAEIICDGAPGVAPDAAALVNAAAAHAFEMDSLRKPGAGVHPGAVLSAAGLATAQHMGSSGAQLCDAMLAGGEVMGRLGLALRRSSEGLGFHAPGITGVFGATATAGRLLGLTEAQLTHAFGIAGSLCAGLMAFAAGDGGAMVKRLHLGRAAQSGVFAAQLAARGYDGPAAVLEGEHGVLAVYARNAQAHALTADLGSRWEMRLLCMKSFACHITAHAPIYALRTLRERYAFNAADIAVIVVRASDAVLAKHALTRPPDLGSAQYSVPYSMAVDLHRDLSDPAHFDDSVLDDDAIAATAAAIELQLLPETAKPGCSWNAEVSVTLHDGRTLTELRDDFPGSPTLPFSTDELRSKLGRLAGLPRADALFDTLMHIEQRRCMHGLLAEWMAIF